MSGLDYLHGVESVTVDDGTRPIRTAKAGIIGIVGTSGKGPVNTPILIAGTPKKAAQTIGAWANDGFTLPEAVDAIFGYIGATLVLVNVCDPAKHKTEVTDELVQLSRNCVGRTNKPYVSAITFKTDALSTVVQMYAGEAAVLPSVTLVSLKSEDGATTYAKDTDFTVEDGVIKAKTGGALVGVTAKLRMVYSTDALTATDYFVDADTGSLTFSVAKLMPNTVIPTSYTYVDPTKVTQADVIGGVDQAGKYTGVNALKAAQSTVFVTPRILLAPHFTHEQVSPALKNPVLAELEGIAESLRAVVYADATKGTIEDAVRYRRMTGSKRVVALYPFIKALAPDNTYVDQPRSIHRAGLVAKTISEQGFHVTPSNYTLVGVSGVTSSVTGDGTDKDSEANYLNSNEVATCINRDGWREWGARTCSDDPKWAFESVVRTADMVQESIMMAHLWAVDRNITKNLVNSIVNSVNAYLRQLKAQDVILGGRCWADPELNTPESVADGKLYIDFDFTPAYPAEHIIFRAHMVNGYITEVFTNN